MKKITMTSMGRLNMPPMGFPGGKNVYNKGETFIVEDEVCDKLQEMGVPLGIESVEDGTDSEFSMNELHKSIMDYFDDEEPKWSQVELLHEFSASDSITKENIKTAIKELVGAGVLSHTGEKIRNSPVFTRPEEAGGRDGDI